MRRTLTSLFTCLLILAAVRAYAEDPFFVHLEDAVPQGNGKIILVLQIENNDLSDVTSFDLEFVRGLSAEKAESYGGWGITKQSATTMKVHTAGKLRPRTNGRFKVTVSGDLDIFRSRSTRNLMTVTAYYGDGRKRVYEVGAPLIKDLR